MSIGPVEYMVVAFPGNKFTGQIVPALRELVESGTVRIIDIAFVMKDENSDVHFFEVADLDAEIAEALSTLGVDPAGLFATDDLVAVGEELEPGSSGALLVWEDLWAARLAQAIRDADGVILDLERVPHEVVTTVRDAITAAAR